MMRLFYGTFDPAAQSCPLFFLQIAGLPEARACLSGRVWFCAVFSRPAPSPVHVTGRRGALFVFLKGVNKYGIKIYLPRLWDPFGL